MLLAYFIAHGISGAVCHFIANKGSTMLTAADLVTMHIAGPGTVH